MSSADLRKLLIAHWLLFLMALPASAEPLNEIWRGLAAYKTGKYEIALELFNSAFQSRTLSYQNRQIVSYNRGLTLFNLENYAGAIDDFDRVLQLNARHFRAFTMRGASYAALGQFYRALQDYNRALKFEPEFALAYVYRANVHERLGNGTQAVKDLERAVALDPKLKIARESSRQPGTLTPQ